MDLLKRELAPIVDEAWKEIDGEAKRVLALNLAGRKLVDFDGPHGPAHAALNLGRLEALEKGPLGGVGAARRVVQPLIEIEAPFRLPLADLDDAARGASDLDLEPVVGAAEQIARAEDSAIFTGYTAGGIRGILDACPHSPLSMPKSATKYPELVLEARAVLHEAGVDGPYALALGTESFKTLAVASDNGYPIRRRIEDQIIDGPLLWVPAIDGAVLLSRRGGDFVLTVGQDLSLAYRGHDRDAVDLAIVESFTFRVLDGSAAVALRPAG